MGSPSVADSKKWPLLSFPEWQSTCDTLHMWAQIVGKTRLELSPYWNHWWQTAFYISARGLTTSPIPYGPGIFEVEFDFLHHDLSISTSQGDERILQLYPRTVADFYREYMATLKSLEIEVEINTVPQEVPDPIPFEKDQTHASYDQDAVGRFWRILVNLDCLFKQFRGGFIGKSSPVHFFWGSFDLALTRFSGRPAPVRKDADAITQEAYSHEVISCGFWPGDRNFPHAALYAYAAPAPAGFGEQHVRPQQAFYSQEMSEFFLKYDDVRSAPSPEQAVLDFCQSTYEAGATLGKWDRKSLERNA